MVRVILLQLQAGEYYAKWNYEWTKSSEVGHSRNRPAMLCFHNSAWILTALINIQVSQYHKGKTAEYALSAICCFMNISALNFQNELNNCQKRFVLR